MDSVGFKNAKKREKTVSRAYGGSRCHSCVRQRFEKYYTGAAFHASISHFYSDLENHFVILFDTDFEYNSLPVPSFTEL